MKTVVPQSPGWLRFVVQGSMVMLYGESTPSSGRYRVYIDGERVEHNSHPSQKVIDYFDAAGLAKRLKGNAYHVQIVAENLATDVEHTIEIEPLFAPDKKQELRLESLCVAGGKATIRPWPEDEDESNLRRRQKRLRLRRSRRSAS